MSDARPTYEELLDLVQQQQRQIEALQAEVARLTAALEEAVRAGKRQAAPFRKGPPKPDPKTPGRKPGDAHGQHGHRLPPPPDQIQETHEATLPDACPHCGGRVAATLVHWDQCRRGSFAYAGPAVQSPDLPPFFSSSRTFSKRMPRSIALHMS